MHIGSQEIALDLDIEEVVGVREVDHDVIFQNRCRRVCFLQEVLVPEAKGLVNLEERLVYSDGFWWKVCLLTF